MKVRPATAEDAGAIQAIYAPIVEQTAISFEETPPTVGDLERKIVDLSKSHAFLVAERGGVVLGYAYGSQHRARAAYRWSAETTIYVADHSRGAGVGKALYGELLPVLKGMGFHAAFAGIALPNAASVALHEAVGFSSIGIFREVGLKFDRWHDVGWWQRVL